MRHSNVRGPGFRNPVHSEVIRAFLVPLIRHVAEAKKQRADATPMLSPAVLRLAEALDTNAVFRQYFTRMVEGANELVFTLAMADPDTYREFWTEDGDFMRLFKSNLQVLELMSAIIRSSPQYNETQMVGTPLNGLLCMCMQSPEGQALFHDPQFNALLKNVLNEWRSFLLSDESLYLLDMHNREQAGSWVSTAAWNACGLDEVALPDPQGRYLGFKSWSEFFIRPFKEGERPFDPDPLAVCNACETGPVKHDKNLQLRRPYWVKAQPYSLIDLFDSDPLVGLFEGGTLYQGFLSATHYHRWHAPVDGEIVVARVVPGTYFAQCPSFDPTHPDPVANEYSQPYIAHTATRAIIIIRTDSAGYVAFLPIGMVEVSSCNLSPHIKPGTKVKKGDELGYFLFGGSTHCLVFQKGKIKLEDWALEENAFLEPPKKLGSRVATILSK